MVKFQKETLLNKSPKEMRDTCMIEYITMPVAFSKSVFFWMGLKQTSQVSAGCVWQEEWILSWILFVSLSFTNMYRFPFLCTSVRDDLFQIWVFCAMASGVSQSLWQHPGARA